MATFIILWPLINRSGHGRPAARSYEDLITSVERFSDTNTHQATLILKEKALRMYYVMHFICLVLLNPYATSYILCIKTIKQNKPSYILCKKSRDFCTSWRVFSQCVTSTPRRTVNNRVHVSTPPHAYVLYIDNQL